MKTLLLSLAFCCAAAASTLVCPPVLSPDSLRVDPTCPGLFASIYVTSGVSVWEGWSNDNPNGSATEDFDLNDGNVRIRMSAGHDVTLEWMSANSNWTNSVSANGSLWVSAAHPGAVDLGILPVGTEIILDLHAQDGHQYYSGDPARNAGTPHWWVGQEVPEPRSALLIGTGLLVLGGIARRRSASAHGW